MRVISIAVRDFLGIARATIRTDRELTVVTGANGAGKSTLFHALRLTHDAVAAADRHGVSTLDASWESAGHHGSESFQVKIDIDWTEPDEWSLIEAFFWSATYGLLHPEGGHADRLEAALDEALPDDAAAPLRQGCLVVDFDGRRRHAWQVAWEFSRGGGTSHLQLMGSEPGHLVDGPLRDAAVPKKHRLAELLPSTNNVIERIRDGVRIDPLAHLDNAVIQFVADQPNFAVAVPQHIAAMWRSLGLSPGPQTRVSFATVMRTLLSRRLQLTDNHRAPIRSRFTAEELATQPDLQDGSMLALELHRLKNGSADERRRFATVQETFRVLTADELDCTESYSVQDGDPAVTLVPIVAGRAGRDVPLERAGAGAAEALHLAVLLADKGRCVFLDEPAVHLAPTVQRRLLSRLREAGQVVVITHNPALVPARDAGQLASVVRMSRVGGETMVTSLAADNVRAAAALARLLASSEVRALLFAAGVVFFEGPTDLAALGVWLDAVDNGAPTPDERNVVFLSVDGQNSFGQFVDLARRLAVPWVIVADGPALRPGSTMADQLHALGIKIPSASATFEEARAAWSAEGVYTLAEQFGDDGSKTGEIEVFLERIDRQALAQARKDVGAKKGTRVGAAFAASVAAPPKVLELWRTILKRLG